MKKTLLILTVIAFSSSVFAARGKKSSKPKNKVATSSQRSLNETGKELARELQKSTRLDSSEAKDLALASQNFKAFKTLSDTLIAKSEQEPGVLGQTASASAFLARSMKEAQVDVGNSANFKNGFFSLTNALALVARGEIKGSEADKVINLTKTVAQKVQQGQTPTQAMKEAIPSEAARKKFEEGCKR